jgi:CDP-glycerol glycerophosphotransferase (TagB/SpsB family)
MFDIKNVSVADKDCDISILLAACDAVLIDLSSVGLEAMIFDRDIINMSFNTFYPKNSLVNEGVAIRIEDASEVPGVMHSLKVDKRLKERLKLNRDLLIKKYLYKADSCASERIVDVLLSVLDKEIDIVENKS